MRQWARRPAPPMPLSLEVHYAGVPVAAGEAPDGNSQAALALPAPSGEVVEAELVIRGADLPAATASCISQWLQCAPAGGDAATVRVPLTLDSRGVAGSRDRPFDATVYVSLGSRLLRVTLSVPRLAAAAEAGTRGPELGTADPSGRTPDTGAPPPAPAEPTPTPPPPAAGEPVGERVASPAESGWGVPHPQPTLPGAPSGHCRNHPETPTLTLCSMCGYPFCPQCLVSLQGAVLCAWCKQMTLARLRAPVQTVDPRAVVAWSRAFDILMIVGAAGMAALQFWIYGFAASMADSGSSQVVFPPPGTVASLATIAPPVAALILALPPAVGLGRGRRWAYLWQMIMLIPAALLSCFWASCLGLFFWPAAVILLIFLLKPEVKAYCEPPAA
jgi:hypothetical protein